MGCVGISFWRGAPAADSGVEEAIRPRERAGSKKRDDARACKVNCTPDLKQWFVKMDQVKDDQRLRGRGSDACWWWRARNARRWQFGGGAAPVAPNGSGLPKVRREAASQVSGCHCTLQRRSDLAASAQRTGDECAELCMRRCFRESAQVDVSTGEERTLK